MTRCGAIDLMLEHYGKPVQVRAAGGESADARAIIQPLGYKNKNYPDEAYLPGGYFDSSHYLYIGPVSRRLDQMTGAEILSDERDYLVRRAHCVAMGDELLYVRAVLQEKSKEEADDGV